MNNLKSQPSAPVARGQRPPILVVDEDVATLDQLADWLRQAGFAPTCACHGQEGVALFRRRHFDLVLADLISPESDGFHVLLAVTIEAPMLPVLVVGPGEDDHKAHVALRAGAWDYLCPPLERDSLLERVHAALLRAERLKQAAPQRQPAPANDDERQKALNLEALGSLCGGLAHDFNNLLTALGGYLDLSLRETDPEAQRQWLKQAKMVNNLAVELTRQLLAFSKGGEPILASVSVRALVGESLGHLGKAMPQLKAEERIAPDIWPVRGDHGQLRTVIRNICYNAAEAMPEGGVLVIEAENLPAGPGGGPAANPLGRDAVRLSLTDHGVGIPPEIIGRIFDPYFTTSPKGAAKGKGLGLALCHTIVSRHQGRIGIKSQLGQGTTVSIILPAATAP